MRWDKLFDDLESQLEREITAEELDLEAEEERLRLGRLAMRDRLVALHESQAAGYELRVTVGADQRMTLTPATFGRDWFSADVVDGSARRGQVIVPIAALSGISLTPSQVAASLTPARVPEGQVSLSSRLGLPFVLRDLCRRRRPIDLVLAHGEVHGTLDRVGRDHVDLAVHDRGSARRAPEVREYRVVPLATLSLVRL